MLKRNSDLNAIEVWSKDTNLIFNPSKTKVMVISSRQMAQYHQLDSSNKVNIKCDNENIERVKEYKLLGIILDEYFLVKFWKMVIPLYEYLNY